MPLLSTLAGARGFGRAGAEPKVSSVEYLVVGGGGGAHGFVQGVEWGEGGNGGTVASSSVPLAISTNYTVTVGAGGAGGPAGANAGSTGANSVFASATGNGGAPGDQAGPFGGSGNGTTNLPISATSSPFSRIWGGLGVTSSISGSSVGYGGGGSYGNANNSEFGEPSDWGKNYGGGWAFTAGGVIQNPIANRGGGGFGGWNSGQGGSAGGSGVVILKYPDSRSITGGAGLTFNTSLSGGFKITTFTAGTGTISFS